MKRFINLLLASAIGSMLTIGVFLLISNEKQSGNKITTFASTPVVGAAYSVNESGEVVPLEFTEVSKDIMPTVVHIRSTIIFDEKRREQMPEQFRENHGDDFFRYFFP